MPTRHSRWGRARLQEGSDSSVQEVSWDTSCNEAPWWAAASHLTTPTWPGEEGGCEGDIWGSGQPRGCPALSYSPA